MLSRAVAGLACRVRVPVRQYDAVAVISQDAEHVIRLMHRDPALSIDVEAFSTFEIAEDYRNRLADFLSLPSLTMAGTPRREQAAEASAPRRNRALRTRRPRFLTRRSTGAAVTASEVVGREIIARN